jgi:hypothetical protein
VRSDFSVFHRVDNLEVLAADRLIRDMVRLPVYDGAVAWALRSEAEEPQPTPAPAVARAAPTGVSLTADQLRQMSAGGLYGPCPSAGQDVGLFEVSTV